MADARGCRTARRRARPRARRARRGVALAAALGGLARERRRVVRGLGAASWGERLRRGLARLARPSSRRASRGRLLRRRFLRLRHRRVLRQLRRTRSHSSSAFCAWRRFSAWSQIALAVPVEDLGGDLLAGVRGQAVQRDRAGRRAVEQRVVDPVGRERARGARRPCPRRPSRPRRRCRRRARRRPPRAGSCVQRAARLRLELVARGRRDRDVDAGERAEHRERARDVVAVADVGELQPVERRPGTPRAASCRSASAWTGGGPR